MDALRRSRIRDERRSGTGWKGERRDLSRGLTDLLAGSEPSRLMTVGPTPKCPTRAAEPSNINRALLGNEVAGASAFCRLRNLGEPPKPRSWFSAGRRSRPASSVPFSRQFAPFRGSIPSGSQKPAAPRTTDEIRYCLRWQPDQLGRQTGRSGKRAGKECATSSFPSCRSALRESRR